MENLVQRVQRELELSRAKGGAIQGLPQNFGGARAPGFRPVAATHAQEGALPDEFGSYVVLSSQKIEAARRHHDATAVPAGPSSSVVHVPGKTSARTFPCQATMQVCSSSRPQHLSLASAWCTHSSQVYMLVLQRTPASVAVFHWSNQRAQIRLWKGLNDSLLGRRSGGRGQSGTQESWALFPQLNPTLLVRSGTTWGRARMS